MKHVIVIMTPDARPVPPRLAERIELAVDGLFEVENHERYVRYSFNQTSAVRAVHEMYDGSTTPCFCCDCQKEG